MTTTALKTYINPSLLDTKLGDIIGNHQYGELIFISEDAPSLTPEQMKHRENAMQDYKNWKNIDDFDDIKNEL